METENKDELKKVLKEKAALEHVQNFMRQSKKFTDRYFKKFNILWAEYTNSRNAKPSGAQRANLRIPYAFNIVEKAVPPIVDAFLGDTPYINALAQNEDALPFEEDISEVLSYQLDQLKFLPKFVVFAKANSIFGTTIAKTPWRYETKLRYKKQPLLHPTLQIPIGESREAYEAVSYDGPDFEPISILDFFPDWTATNPGDIDSMRGCVHRVWRTMEELEKRKKVTDANGDTRGIYINLDKLKLSLQDNGDNAWANCTESASEPDYSSKYAALNQPNGIKEASKFQVWEYWGLFKPPGAKNWMEYTIAVANGDTLIRCDTNPLDGQFKPFIGTVCYPVPGEFYGIGDIEPCLSMIREAVALRNARLDQANMAVNRMWVVDRTAGINLRSLYSRGGGVILSNDINGIKSLEVAEVPGSSYKEMAEIGYNIQDTTTQLDTSAGASNLGSAFGRTATGVSFLQSQTTGRLAVRVKMYNEMVFRRLGEIMMMHNQQFLEDDVLLRIRPNIKENPFKRVPLDAFSKNYSYTAAGAYERLSHKEQQLNFQNNIVPYLKMLEESRPGTVKLDAITEIYLKLFDIRDPRALINDEETQARYAEEMAAREAQMEMAKADQNAKSQANAQSMLLNTKAQNQYMLNDQKAQHRMIENEQKAENDSDAHEQEVDSKTANEIVKALINE